MKRLYIKPTVLFEDVEGDSLLTLSKNQINSGTGQGESSNNGSDGNLGDGGTVNPDDDGFFGDTKGGQFEFVWNDDF